MRDGIVLIGMPGAGKSTVGRLLARRLGRAFIDTDALIEARAGRTLQQIVDSRGQAALREAEAAVLAGLAVGDAVVATGGSAVYSEAGMAHLRRQALIVWLDVAEAELRRRLADFATRGIARRAGQSLAELFEERRVLYRRHADARVDGTGRSAEELAETVATVVAKIMAGAPPPAR